jgi:23S rRNA (cytosine1962-C5)-methyltransferase
VARVHLRKSRARPLWARNPTVFAGSIARVDGDPGSGDVVDVVDHRGKFIARGFFDAASAARVAALTWDPDEAVDEDLLGRRIEEARRLRGETLGLPDDATDAYRMVHGAGDGLPGLVVDRYGDWLSVRLGSPGLERRRDALGRILIETLGARGVWVAREPSLRSRRGEEAFTGLLAGDAPPDPVVFREGGLEYAVSLAAGLKTGHFLDQRDNRLRVASFVRGRNVLDAFCATGGFAVAASALGGAASVRAVDESAAALAHAAGNALRNGVENVEWVEGDVFADLRALEAAGERFGAIVLDPPAFARTAREKARALRGYKEINLRALGLLEPGGVLATCSCSSPITADDLEIVLREAGMDRGLDVRVLERRGQGPDHPVSAAAPESRYLDCLIVTTGAGRNQVTSSYPCALRASSGGPSEHLAPRGE